MQFDLISVNIITDAFDGSEASEIHIRLKLERIMAMSRDFDDDLLSKGYRITSRKRTLESFLKEKGLSMSKCEPMQSDIFTSLCDSSKVFVKFFRPTISFTYRILNSFFFRRCMKI